MAISYDVPRPAPKTPQDPRALRILAKTIFRELRESGLGAEEVMAVAGEMLSLVAGDVKERRLAREFYEASLETTPTKKA
jgi:hypothetical protein